MGFLIYCDNKGCGKEQESLLDLETNEAICVACGKSINRITNFTKTQMKNLGQVKRQTKSQESLAIKCNSCQKHGRPKINQNKIMCAFCSTELTELSIPFKQMLLSNK